MQGLHPTLRGRVRRLWLSIVPISQCAIAAGLAWFIAFDLLNHERPFFAPIAAVVSLGLSLARRWRRSVELIFGVSIGILVGDVVITWIGSGAWQISVVVAAAMAVAVFADKGPMLPTQAASSAVLVATLLPPGDAAAYRQYAPMLARRTPPAWTFIHGPRSSLSSSAIRKSRT